MFYEITTDEPAADGETECIAFFQFDQVGEQPGWTTDVSDGVGLPFWVNHCAFRATAEQQEAVRARMAAEGIEPAMEQDHGWCHSLYYLDPNGIMVELCRDTPGFEPDPTEAHRLLGVDPLVEAANHAAPRSGAEADMPRLSQVSKDDAHPARAGRLLHDLRRP